MQAAQSQAARAVKRVLDGSTLTSALAAVARPGDDAGRRRALVQELAYGTLRHWGTLDALVRKLARKPFSDPELPALVAVALYQLGHTRAPAFAVVDHAVAAAGQLARPAAKALVNAMLRRYLRERETLDAALAGDPVARWSHPAWWVRRVQAEYPDEWQAVLAAGNERPPLALRVNRRVCTRESLLARLAQAGIPAVPVGEHGVIVTTPKPIPQLPGYDDGAFAVQDAGAQLAAPLLQLADGMRVLDACAAPGGKSTHIAELADVELVSLDESDARLARVRENFERLKLDVSRVRIVVGDAGTPAAWWDGRAFDRILADVPCTASGVVRRHPDGKWLRRESDIASFARAQHRLLEALWPLLAAGGLLLYATCSLFDAENDAQVRAFLERHADAQREPVAFGAQILHRGGQLLPSLPGAVHNQDGFFYALLRKSA